jgi:hypothetical protein
MPVGSKFVNEVASVLNDKPASSTAVRLRLAGTYSSRAVRYALKSLVSDGRASRKGYRSKYIYCAAPKAD